MNAHSLFSAWFPTLAVCALALAPSRAAAQPMSIPLFDMRPSIEVSVPDPIASELGSSTALFKLTRTGTNLPAMQVQFVFSGAAIPKVDYESVPTSIQFGEGQAAAFLKIVPIDDHALEPPESVILSVILPRAQNGSLIQPSAYLLGRSGSASVTIVDDEIKSSSLPQVTITATDSSASELGPNPGTITVRREGSLSTPLRVEYEFLGAVTVPAQGGGPAETVPAAVNSRDFETLPNSITIPANTASAAIVIRPIEDNLVEGRESVTLRLKRSAPYQIKSPDVATVLIADNSQAITPTVTVSVSDNRAIEPESANASDPGTFVIQRTGSTLSSLIVSIILSGTAQNGVDYEQLPSSITIPPGKASFEVSIRPIADRALEPNESVILTVGQSQAYQIGSARQGTLEIVNRVIPETNRPPAIFLVSPTNNVTFERGTTITLRAEASDPDGVIARVEFRADDTLLTIDTNAPYSFVWTNASPGSHVLIARATDNRGATALSREVSIFIAGGNDRPVVTVEADDPAAAEPGAQLNTGSFTLTRTGSLTQPLRVFYSISGTASNGVDFARLDGDATIAAGIRVRRISVQPIADNLSEPTESVRLALRTDPAYSIGASSNATVEIRSGQGPTNAPVQVILTAPTNGTVFRAPASIRIEAVAIDSLGYLPRVEFFEGNRKIGTSEIVFIRAPDPGTPIHHSFLWTNVPPGHYVLTARAVRSSGQIIFSNPSAITVSPPPESKRELEHRGKKVLTASHPLAGPPAPALFLDGSLLAAQPGFGGGLLLYFLGQPGLIYQVEGSNDFLIWTLVDIQQSNAYLFEAPVGPDQTYLFYRARAFF